MGLEKISFEDLGQLKRPLLGPDVPIMVYRLLRLDGMHRILGRSAGPALYLVGQGIGEGLGVSRVDEFARLVKDLKIGFPEIIEATGNKIDIRVNECMTCAGLPNIGEKVCDFEAGIIAGALSKILKRPTKATETHCYASGDGFCQFEVLLF